MRAESQEKLHISLTVLKPALASCIETSLSVAVARGEGWWGHHSDGGQSLLKWFRNSNTTDKLIAHVLLANEIDLSNIS